MNFLRMGYLPSMVLYGPPGVGKTTLASILASEAGYVFLELSATDATTSQLRDLLKSIRMENAKRKKSHADWLRVVVFIDEIHRFTTVQQDFLLPFVESGDFVFIGATTVDPQKRIRRAILSRCQLFNLKPLETESIITILRRAVLLENIRRKRKGFQPIDYSDSALLTIAKTSNGDTRSAINSIELISLKFRSAKHLLEETTEPMTIDHLMAASMMKTLLRAQNGLQNEESLPIVRHMLTCLNKVAGSTTQSAKPASCVEVMKSEGSFMVKIDVRRALNVASDLESEVEWPGDAMKEHGEPKLNAWADHMEVSDDSDVEPGPIYSDDEIDVDILDKAVLRSAKTSALKHSIQSAIVAVLSLLKRGESASYILKHLILYLCLRQEGNTPELTKLVAALKAMQKSTANIYIILSNCIERLATMRTTSGSLLLRMLRSSKKFISTNTNHSTPDAFALEEAFQIEYDDQVVKELLEDIKFPLVEDSVSQFPIDEVTSLESDFTLGGQIDQISTLNL